jgi:hypothetical protein
VNWSKYPSRSRSRQYVHIKISSENLHYKHFGLVDIRGDGASILLAPDLAIPFTRMLVVKLFTVEKLFGLVDIGTDSWKD